MPSTPPGCPGQPQQPVSPDGHWWWDGAQWRPNQAHPVGPDESDLDNTHAPTPAAETVRFHPGPPAVPNPYVPPRLADGSGVDAEPSGAPLDDVPLLLASQPRSWWTPQRFVLAVAGVVLAILLGIGLLFWLSINAFEKQRTGDTGPQPTPTSVVTRSDETGSLPS
ncbi:MAG TPA: hypothetical protein VGC04_06280 [Cellulomonas sp.]